MASSLVGDECVGTCVCVCSRTHTEMHDNENKATYSGEAVQSTGAAKQ